VILFFVAFLSFIVSVKTFLDKYDRGEIEQKDVIIRLLDLVTISVPPALPTCLSFGISFSLKRMNKKKVFCINPEKINICGIVKTICFDKTGTLTEEKLSFKVVSAYD
jgi:cation-transporting ATPase 13A2